jgi:choloylglycine hydrolase
MWVLLHAGRAVPCTAFLLTNEGRHYVGKSYDYEIGYGRVIQNKRGVHKRAFSSNRNATAAEWVSRYASLTFNQFGREMPNGGINEAGLVVEVLWLDETRAPPPDHRPAVNELQWIQMQLDSYGSVDEVLDNVAAVRIAPVYGKVHYLVCDSGGACGAVELVEGALVITSGTDLVAKTLTNDTYAASCRALRRSRGFGGERRVPAGKSSLDRFVRASAMAAETTRERGIDRVFEILDAVNLGAHTKWQVAYDLETQTIHFRSTAARARKTARLADFPGGCHEPVMVLDIDNKAAGDARPRFRPYQRSDNARLLHRSLAHLRSALPPGAADALVAYPDTLACIRTGP